MPTRTHHQTLTAQLEGWDAERLAALVLRRPDLVWPRPPADLAELASRAHAQPSIVSAIRAANLPENRLMQVLVCCKPDLTEAELVDHLPSGTTLPDVEPVLASLEQAALVWRSAGRIHISGSLRQAMPTTLGPPVAQLVKDQPVDYLRHVAERVRRVASVPLAGHLPPPAVGPGGRPPRKAELVDEVEALLATPGVVESVLLAAPPEALELARRMAFGRPLVHVDRPLHLSRYDSPYERSARAGDPAAWLFEHGLIVPFRDDHEGWQPREAGLALRGGKPVPDLGLVAPPLDVADADQAAVDRDTGESAPATTLGRLADLLDAWAEAPVKQLKSGGLGVSTVKQLAAQLDADVDEAGRLVELLHLAGLVDARTTTRKERRQVVADTATVPAPAAAPWLAAADAERWASLVTAWVRAEHWPSATGRRRDGSKPVPVTGHLPGYGAAARRADVLGALARLPPGPRHHAVNELVAHVFWARPQPWLDVRIDEPPEVIGWILAEAELLGLVADGALSTAGRLLLAGDRDGVVAALAAALPEEGRSFTLQADLTATVVGRLERDVLAELRLLADVESTGLASTYRFSDASLRRGLDAGRSGDAVLAFLEAHAARGVPPALAYLVGDVARRHGHLRVGAAGAFVTSDDPAALADACSHKLTRKVALRLLAPTVAVSAHPPAAVITALRDAGFLPTADGPDPTTVALEADVLHRYDPYRAEVRDDTRLPERFVVREHGQPPLAVDDATAAELGARWAAKRPWDGGGRPARFRPRAEGVGAVSDGPLIVQSDKTMLLEVDHPLAVECRLAISPFSELERAPEHIHTYRITPLGLWNACAAGIDAEQVVDALVRYSRFPVPTNLLVDVAETIARHGRLVLEVDDRHGLVLRTTDRAVLEEVVRAKAVAPLLGPRLDDDTVSVPPAERGRLKQALLKVGWPADDRAGYVDGASYPVLLDEGEGFSLRPYQREAIATFFASGTGVVVLPCGAGKTLVGAGALASASARTLILVTNTVSARQWRDELLARTSLTADEIGEYSGDRKEIKPVTIATYQILIARTKGEHRHFAIFDAEDWGLVIYDEVHLLPAPVFRMTAEIQSRRRLGLTATLVREDGREGDVFSLIGPKRYEAPWREMEAQGWIAPATCTEVRVTLTDDERMTYALGEPADRHRIGATAVSKLAVIDALVRRHAGELTLVIGMYLDQLEAVAARLHAPLITGKTPVKERERLYAAFRAGEEPVLVVSKVANFSIDLPDASVAVQISGTFGSRQEEAQRLGRILRPKADGRQARFYTVVSRDTNEQEFAAKRQRFLAEQGYAYEIVDADGVLVEAERARIDADEDRDG